MAEFNFDDFKKTITGAAGVATKKAGTFVSVQKLKGQIYTLERSIDKKYQELGAMVFDDYAKGEKVNDESTVVCEEISQVNANIAELREELANKHGCKVCSVCESEVPLEAMFCMKCGTQMPEPDCCCHSEEDCDCGCGCTKDNEQEVKEVVKSAGQEVKAAVVDASKEAKDIATGASKEVKDIATGASKEVKDIATGAGKEVKDIAVGAGQGVKEVVKNVGGIMKDAGADIKDALNR